MKTQRFLVSVRVETECEPRKTVTEAAVKRALSKVVNPDQCDDIIVKIVLTDCIETTGSRIDRKLP